MSFKKNCDKSHTQSVMSESDKTSPNSIKIVPNDPTWPELYRKEAAKIKAALGNHCIELHHIGSTSIQDLAAKPIIDIIAVVSNITAVDNHNPEMVQLGYEPKGESGMPFKRFFQKFKSDENFNLHVYEQGNAEIDRCIKFRDWMQNNSDDRISYEKLKTELARKYPDDVMAYCIGKEQFVTKIDEKTGWNGVRIVVALTPREWESYHRIRMEQIFSHTKVKYDINHPTITAENHFHFVLFSNMTIVSIAHIEFLSDNEAAIRSIATDEPFKGLGFASLLLKQLERWLKQHGKNIVKTHANLRAEKFYRKQGYSNMDFDDVSISTDIIDLGKELE